MPTKNKAEKSDNKDMHRCPYCDMEIRTASYPYCVGCNVNFINCPSCNTDYSHDLDNCPECGAETRKPMIGI
jgi:hypothetical protein